MCGRYQLITGENETEMKKMIEICNANPKSAQPVAVHGNGEIRPGDVAPALVQEQGRTQAIAMQWGFSGNSGNTVINARSEDVAQRAMFRSLTGKNRCVLVSAGYYEWRKRDHQKYFVHGNGIVYLAGLYKMDEDGKLRYVVLTKEAFGEHSKVHNRMPVVLKDRSEAREWLCAGQPFSQYAARQAQELVLSAVGYEQVQMDFEGLV